MSYENPMNLAGRLLIAAYAAIAYIGFLAIFAVFVLWSLGLGLSIDSAARIPLAHTEGGAMLVDLGLIALFGLQHTVMARRSFKRVLTRVLPAPAERPTFVMASNIVLALIVVAWQPLPQPLWHFDGAVGIVLLGINLLGWLFLVAATFMISHFELFGLKQAWQNLRARALVSPQFSTRFAYAFMRHPMMSGLLVGLWVVPSMSVGHLVLTLGFSAYILVGTVFEERDLTHYLGSAYVNYRRQVPRFIPWPGRKAVPAQEVRDGY